MNMLRYKNSGYKVFRRKRIRVFSFYTFYASKLRSGCLSNLESCDATRTTHSTGCLLSDCEWFRAITANPTICHLKRSQKLHRAWCDYSQIEQVFLWFSALLFRTLDIDLQYSFINNNLIQSPTYQFFYNQLTKTKNKKEKNK